MVTSHKMSENKMDYRGSKSEIIQTPQPIELSVKEQRVDGSYFGKYPKLRCTLVGFERNYRIKILSKQFINRKFSTLNTLSNLNPFYVSGLIDAEGSFSTTIYLSNKYRTG
jgi:hypothetical protein